MTTRRLIFGTLIMLLPSPLTAQAAAPFNPEAIVRQRFDALADMAAGPRPMLILGDDGQKDGVAEEGKVILSNATIRSARSTEELDGLLAFLIISSQPRSGFIDRDTSRSVASVLAAGAVIAAGERIDHIDQRDAPPEARRDYVWTPREPPDPGGTIRGRAALALMQRAKTCSGAALAFMNRLASPRNLVTDPPIKYIAQRARRDFGSLASPPDSSCISS